MGRNWQKWFWGLIFIATGVIITGNILELWSIKLFDGWWTLFVILPSLGSIIGGGFRLWNTAVLCIGLLLLAAMQNFLDINVLWKLILPIVLLTVGLHILFSDKWAKKRQAAVFRVSEKSDNNYMGIFAGQNVQYPNEKFTGAALTAIFGGVELNLKSAIISEDVAVVCTSIFGGVTIIVPANVKVMVNSTPIFGGVSNDAPVFVEEGLPVIHVRSLCVFGGVEIK